MDKILAGGHVVIPYVGVQKIDIGITDGKISALAPNLQSDTAEIIDVAGKHIFPGAIDGHSHYGVYGGLEGLAEDYYKTSRSSALGGVTTVINFMRSSQSYTEQLPTEIAIAEQQSAIDFCFHLGIMTNKHLAEMRTYVEQFGATSYKLYLGYRGQEQSRFGTDRLLDDELLLDIFAQMNAISKDLVLAIHCENVDMGKHYFKQYEHIEDRNELVFFEKYNPDIVETESVVRCATLAMHYDAKITVVHMSAGTSMQALENMKNFNPDIVNVETCPHYLLETVDNAKGLGAIVKPPLRYEADNALLWEGIQKGIVKFVGTDHVSISWQEKFKNGYDIDKTVLGFGGAEFMFPLTLSEGHFKHGLPLEKIAEITSANTAKTYGMYPQKGAIEIGSDADFVVVDLQKAVTITPDILPINSDYTIYEGRHVQGWPVMTLRRGDILAKDGNICDTLTSGRYIFRQATPIDTPQLVETL